MAEVTELEQQEKTSAALTGGALLQSARATQQLSIEHVARFLHLTDSVVKAIERSEIPGHVPVIYLRGYLRTYAKLVGVDAEQVLAGFQLRDNAAAGIAGIQNLQTMPTGNRRRSSSMKQLALGLLLLLLLGLLSWWGWRGFPLPFAVFTQGEISSSVESTQALTNEPVAQAPTVDAANVTDGAANATRELPLQLAPEEVLPQALSAEPLASETVSVPEGGAVKSMPPVSTGQNKAEQKSAIAMSAGSANLRAETVKPTISTGPEKAAKITESLSFSFDEDCWVRVTDARGEVLAVGTKRKGYRFTVAGVAPLKIDLGNPVGVEIRHNGRVLDLSEFSQGKPARVNISAASNKTEAGTFE